MGSEGGAEIAAAEVAAQLAESDEVRRRRRRDGTAAGKVAAKNEIENGNIELEKKETAPQHMGNEGGVRNIACAKLAALEETRCRRDEKAARTHQRRGMGELD